MAKTFEDSKGNVVEIDKDYTEVHENTDIVTGDVSGYFIVIDGELKYEVNEETYNAVKKYIKE